MHLKEVRFYDTAPVGRIGRDAHQRSWFWTEEDDAILMTTEVHFFKHGKYIVSVPREAVTYYRAANPDDLGVKPFTKNELFLAEKEAEKAKAAPTIKVEPPPAPADALVTEVVAPEEPKPEPAPEPEKPKSTLEALTKKAAK